jgi:hypothetical protein
MTWGEYGSFPPREDPSPEIWSDTLSGFNKIFAVAVRTGGFTYIATPAATVNERNSMRINRFHLKITMKSGFAMPPPRVGARDDMGKYALVNSDGCILEFLAEIIS